MSRFNIRPYGSPAEPLPEPTPESKRKYTRHKPYQARRKRNGVAVQSLTRIRCDQRAIEIYNAILSYYAEQGMMPTIRELNAITSANSTSMVNYYLQRLEAWGWIQRPARSGRAIRLLRVSEAGYMRSTDGGIEPVTFEVLQQRYLKGKESTDGR